MNQLTLKNIADWQLNPQSGDFPTIGAIPIVAGIPSLQRGAVWEPQQIEMLWDSIFRGFPFGSIVLSKRIENQEDKSSLINPSTKSKVSYHLLDGQQRCNAIAWGFANPWRDNVSADQILWLDLNHGQRLTKTSKKFLFRVTTKAHPWGFSSNEQSTQLSVQQIRESVGEKEIRPDTKSHIPFDAGCPIPLCYLFEHFDGNNLNLNNILEAMKNDNCPAADKLSKKLNSIPKINIETIEQGLKKACGASVNYLLAPEISDANESIDAIEQIFIRLNRQGTPLDPEELAYSMIKAHWPEIEQTISAIKLKHTTDARLVYMLLRAKRTQDKLASELSVDQIRLIFKGNYKEINKETVESYFKGASVARSLEWIDNNLVYDDSRKYGMPKYLRSSIAWSSKQVFTWWLVLAEKPEYHDLSAKPEIARKIIWLSLAIHWFGEDKEACVNAILEAGKDDPENLLNFDVKKLNTDGKKRLIRKPLAPESFDEAIKLSLETSEDHLKKWVSFWHGIVKLNAGGYENKQDEMIEEGLFFERLKDLREMLVYTQREYIEDKFQDFDPSNKLMWKGYNRPWDYDHILPSNKLNAQGSSSSIGEYHKVCKAWQQSIGNLVAVDFSFNREAQDTLSASDKYKSRNELFASFDQEALSAFDLELESTKDFNASRDFVLACYKRMKNIYSEWWSLQ